MANVVFGNNASSLLAVGIDNSIETIQVDDSTSFPAPSGTQFFYATLENDSGDIEIVKVVDNTANVLTLEAGGRGQDGIPAKAFIANVTRVELRLVKIVMEEFIQQSGDSMQGDLDMNSNNIIDAILSGASTQILAGEIVAVPLRGEAGTSTNEIAVPTNGIDRATAGAAELLVVGDNLEQYLAVIGIITFASATVGIKLPAGAYDRQYDADDSHYWETTHDGTDLISKCIVVAGGTPEGMADFQHDLQVENVLMQDNTLERANVKDMSVEVSPYAGTVTTLEIDYELGSYCDITLVGNVTAGNLTLINAPITGTVGIVRMKITQGGTGGYTIDWAGVALFPRGISGGENPPVLSADVGDVDYVDLWTDDGGLTWYGTWENDWIVIT